MMRSAAASQPAGSAHRATLSRSCTADRQQPADRARWEFITIQSIERWRGNPPQQTKNSIGNNGVAGLLRSGQSRGKEHGSRCKAQS
jgi:hypothetical protein